MSYRRKIIPRRRKLADIPEEDEPAIDVSATPIEDTRGNPEVADSISENLRALSLKTNNLKDTTNESQAKKQIEEQIEVTEAVEEDSESEEEKKLTGNTPVPRPLPIPPQRSDVKETSVASLDEYSDAGSQVGYAWDDDANDHLPFKYKEEDLPTTPRKQDKGKGKERLIETNELSPSDANQLWPFHAAPVEDPFADLNESPKFESAEHLRYRPNIPEELHNQGESWRTAQNQEVYDYPYDADSVIEEVNTTSAPGEEAKAPEPEPPYFPTFHERLLASKILTRYPGILKWHMYEGQAAELDMTWCTYHLLRLRQCEPPTHGSRILDVILLEAMLAKHPFPHEGLSQAMIPNNIGHIFTRGQARFIIAHMAPNLYEHVYFRIGRSSEEDLDLMREWKFQIDIDETSLINGPHMSLWEAISRDIREDRDKMWGRVMLVNQYLKAHDPDFELGGPGTSESEADSEVETDIGSSVGTLEDEGEWYDAEEGDFSDAEDEQN